jgi:hypothetical protein
MVIAKENPRTNGQFIRPKFVLKKEKDRSFFGFIWIGLLQGIKTSVGLDIKKEKEIRTQADRYSDFKNFTKELKESRLQRKKERLKTRTLKQQENRKKNTSMLLEGYPIKTI